MSKKIKITESNLIKIIEKMVKEEDLLQEQKNGVTINEDLGSTTFTSMDRRMLNAIYDVIVKGGAGGGYKGGRRRSIQPLGGIPKH